MHGTFSKAFHSDERINLVEEVAPILQKGAYPALIGPSDSESGGATASGGSCSPGRSSGGIEHFVQFRLFSLSKPVISICKMHFVSGPSPGAFGVGGLWSRGERHSIALNFLALIA